MQKTTIGNMGNKAHDYLRMRKRWLCHFINLQRSNTRRIGAAVACATVAILVAGCGGKGEGKESAVAGNSEAARKTEVASPSAVGAIFGRADEVARKGGINFCGFYLGMTAEDAKALATHYGLEEGEWNGLEVPSAKVVCSFKFSLQGVRRITNGGNSFDELVQAVSSRVGPMKPDRDEGSAGYEYKNIDGQWVSMSENDGLMLKDDALSRKADAEAAEAERKAAEERAKLKAAMAAKALIEGIPDDMVPIPGKNYALCKYEVTQALWEAVMGENPSWSIGPTRPVERVSWDDCQKFLLKLNDLPEVKKTGVTYRLPTAEEWQYACRAGAEGIYCKLADGTEITKDTLGEVAWYQDNSNGETHPVGTKKPNAFGLYDMHGNVWEWTSTPWGDLWVRLGGGYNGDAIGCNVGNRTRDDHHAGRSSFGLRLAR